MYAKPHAERFSPQILADLLGPVETQYDCQTCLIPQATIVESALTVRIDATGCESFTDAEVVVTPLGRLLSGDFCDTTGETIRVARGQLSDLGQNTFVLNTETSGSYCGQVRIDCTLTNGESETQTCSITIQVGFVDN